MTEPKFPSAPSPAGETASERACANCKLGEAGHYREDGDERLRCLPGRDGRYRGLFYAPIAVPDPVPTEGPKGIHVPRIPGTVNTPVGPMIPKSAPEAAAAPHQARKLYQGRAAFDFIRNGEFQTDGFAVTVAGHVIAECEDSEVADWISKQWNERSAAPIAPAAEELHDPNYVHMKILRGEIALTKAQAIHIAGLPADVEERLKPAASPVAGVSAPDALRKAARLLVDAMQTCHICKSMLLLPDAPTHCEDCSGNCEGHGEPECAPISVLHQRLLDLLVAQPSAEGDGWIAVTERDKPTGEDHLLSLEIVEGDTERRVQAVGYFNRLTRSWFINGADVGELRVDYYRPLPAPPSGQGEVK